MKEFQAIQHIAELNNFKMQSKSLILSREDFCAALKNCSIPSNALFFNEFRNSGLLVKVGKDTYAWKDIKPIHFKTLQLIYCTYQNKLNKYLQTYNNKKKEKDLLKREQIESAITLLKNNGFEIFAPYKGLYKKL